MSIKIKLTTIMMLTSVSALLLTGIGFVVWESYTLQKSVVQNLSIQAKVIAENCRESLASDSPAYTEETLAKLCANPAIAYASVRDTTGQVFSTYNRDKDDKNIYIFEVNDDGYGMGNFAINIREDVVHKGKVVGVVCIRSDLNPVHVILKHNIAIFVPVLLFAFFAAYIVSSRLQNIISEPILKLANTVKTISEKKDYSIRVPKRGNDEVATLIGAFNEMLEQIQRRDLALVKAKNELEIKVKDRTLKLNETNKQLKNEIVEREEINEKLKETYDSLVEASHQAGMMQVATDVLHNVGNVLNSVNITTTLIAEINAQSKVSNLKKATEMIEEHSDDLAGFLSEDEQGKHVPAYLIKVAKLLAAEQAEVTEKLESLVLNVNHIKEIVNMQQSYSKVSGVEVSTSLADLIDNSIYVNSSSFDRHGIQLVREYPELAEVNIDKQRVLQILVNLIANAKHSVIHSEKKEKLLSVGYYLHGEDTLRIEVADNGVGIAKENLTRIFSHGFTTKKDGNGFGLHSAALAANEMGGAVSVHSDGVGEGAIFRFDLPFKPADIMTTVTN